MDINELKGCISDEEATIQSFVRDPEFAEYYMQSVLRDGDAEEVKQGQALYNEAQKRMQELNYWSSLIEHAERTAKNGNNIDGVISLVIKALNILKSASSDKALTA